MKRWMIVAVLGLAAPASGGPLAHPGDAEVAALRARLPDPGARCTLGAVYARRGDLPRAALFLDGCDAATLDPEIADAVARAAADTARKLRASELSALSIVTDPPGLVAETDALPGEHVVTPATVWARAGTYRVRAAADVESLAGKAVETTVKLDARSRGSVVLAAAAAKASAPRDGTVDFSDESAGEAAQSGPPPDVKHGTILPRKYIDGGTIGGPQIDDPFAVTRSAATGTWRLGVRLATGLVDRPGASAGLGLSLAAVAIHPIEGPLQLTARLDWSHRGVDAFGADAGLAVGLVDTGAWSLVAGASLRAVVRIQDQLAMQPVRRAGIGGAAELGAALHGVPLLLGLRFEQDFSELVEGARAREHALLLQLGYDWR